MHPFFTEALARERIDGYRRAADRPGVRGARPRWWRRLLGRWLIRAGTRLAPPPPVPAPRPAWPAACGVTRRPPVPVERVGAAPR